MKRAIKILKKGKVITISLAICIISFIFIIFAKGKTPKLVINGYNLSVNENIVYIDGAVKLPGTYIFKDGATLSDVINGAGGLKENADLESVDFDMVMKSGQKIIIDYIKDDDYGQDLIDINKASKEELMSIDGIGEKMAENIIKYREEKPFECIEDIMNVEGIGIKKFSNIKEKIVVE